MSPTRNTTSKSVESVAQEGVESRVSVSPGRELGKLEGLWESQPGEHVLKRNRQQSWHQGFLCISIVGSESQAQNGVFHELLLGSIPGNPVKAKLPKGRGPSGSTVS